MEEKRGRSLLMKKIIPPHLKEKMERRGEGDSSDEEEGEGVKELPPLPPPAFYGVY